jgi:UDP-N-acetyl-D-mannosaminuronic acid dehydrogenase
LSFLAPEGTGEGNETEDRRLRLMPEGTVAADICVVGGAGHVGLPLSIVMGSRGYHVVLYDVNQKSLDTIASGKMPFIEHGAEPLLREVLDKGALSFSTRPEVVRDVETVVIIIGTPVDEFMNPSLKAVKRCIDELLPYLRDDQLMVLRSTVYPGVTESIAEYLLSKGKKIRVSFCPERIVQGHAVEELQTLPQIVSGTTPEAEERAAKLFAPISSEIVRLAPVEAELVKLFNNAYRYIQFAVANQFYLIAHAAGVDYYRVLDGMRRNYPRGEMPGAGLAAGPCLFKDTMQLAAFYRNQFSLGFAAMLVNEGMPQFIVDLIAAQHRLQEITVGLLGMAFKANIDYSRSSLSYKLKKLLALKARRVLTTDPYVQGDPDLVPLERVLAESDVLVLCAPHDVYRELDLGDRPVFDIWNFWGHQAEAAEFAGAAHHLNPGPSQQ